MADPKYANLPGIAHDQPDVYETSDLPESDQHLPIRTEEDSVEILHVSPGEAVQRFRGCDLSADKVDFSDRIRSGRKGYVASTTGTYSVGVRHEEETPLERYQRLHCELYELCDDLEALTAKDDSNTSSLKELALQTDALHSQLRELQMDDVLGSEKIKDLQDPSGKQCDKLLSQLSQLVNHSTAPSTKKVGPTKDDGPTDVVTYEFYLKPETAKMQHHMELANLEKRLETIERYLGACPEKMSTLNVETNEKTVLNAISVLASRTYLLEPSHLDHVEGRLYALHQKIRDISERKAVIDDAEKQNKISELYDLVKKNEGLSSALPEIVNRLESLDTLHQQALDFSKALSQLDMVQEKLVAKMGNNQKLLSETQKKMMDNFSVIQKNCGSIEGRIEKLQQK